MDINILIEKLEEIIQDKFPRERIDDFEQGKMVGKLEILQYIKNLKEGN